MNQTHDHCRREARATFARAVAHLHNILEARKIDLGDQSIEVITDLAILATLGPPLADHETTRMDSDDAPDLLLEEIPAVLRQNMVLTLATEITVAAAVANQNNDGWSKDREEMACQIANQLMSEALDPENPPNMAQQNWHTAAAYLGNHDDGHWLVLSMAVEGHEDDEQDS